MQPIRSPLRVARFELFISLLKVQSTIDWLKIVQFTGIPHISLVILGDSAERVLRTIVDIVPLPILETIDVPGTAEIIHFLAANPLYTSQIRFLVLRLPESYTERELRVQANPSFGSINMPFLHHYHGPFHLLAMFKPDRVLRTLISSDRRTLYDDTQVFASLTKCTDLEVLCIRVYRVTQGFLETICSRYSHLKKLSVQYDCIKQGNGDIDGHGLILALGTLSLPPNIQDISIFRRSVVLSAAKDHTARPNELFRTYTKLESLRINMYPVNRRWTSLRDE